MRSKNSTPVGALHPILFFAGLYVVVLFFSIFICSTIFYSCNASKANASKKMEKQAPEKQGNSSASTIASIQ
jgi:hypothetical protein